MGRVLRCSEGLQDVLGAAATVPTCQLLTYSVHLELHPGRIPQHCQGSDTSEMSINGGEIKKQKQTHEKERLNKVRKKWA